MLYAAIPAHLLEKNEAHKQLAWSPPWVASPRSFTRRYRTPPVFFPKRVPIDTYRKRVLARVPQFRPRRNDLDEFNLPAAASNPIVRALERDFAMLGTSTQLANEAHQDMPYPNSPAGSPEISPLIDSTLLAHFEAIRNAGAF